MDSLWMNYDLDLKNTRATGMQVLIHAPGTEPNMKLGMGVANGMSTTVKLEQTKLTRLPDPYSNCTPQKTLGLVDESTSYTKAYCVDVCFQRQYLQKCGCVESTLQFAHSQLQDANFKVCGNVSVSKDTNNSFNWDGVNQMLCVDALTDDQSGCQKECLTPCEEYQYSWSISAASWPHISSQLSVYYTYIKGNPWFPTKFEQYDTVTANAFTNKPAARELLKKLDREGLIKDNFLQLNIQFNTHTYTVQKDVEAFPMDALGAQIGGVLALWLGMTVSIIFEIIEFILNIIYAWYLVATNEQRSSKEVFDSKL